MRVIMVVFSLFLFLFAAGSVFCCDVMRWSPRRRNSREEEWRYVLLTLPTTGYNKYEYIWFDLILFYFLCVRVVAMIGADLEPDATLKVFSLSGRAWGCWNQHATNRVPAMCPSSKTNEVPAPLSFSPLTPSLFFHPPVSPPSLLAPFWMVVSAPQRILHLFSK